MSEQKTFYCLRCQHRFDVEVDPKRTVERSCPRCGSNSVRAETAAAASAYAARKGGSHVTGH